MASVAVRSGTATLGSLGLQCKTRCSNRGAARSALLPVRKPALQSTLQSKFQGKRLSRPSASSSHGPSMVVAAPPPPSVTSSPEDDNNSPFSGFDYGAKPPFTLADIRNAIPKQCWEKNTLRSLSYLARDVLIVAGLAVAAASINNWLVWPLYWLAQGTMFWALFVVGHDCGHGSFSNSKKLNDFIGHLTHSSILVPYHGWRISHRTHHANHGHVENDESWHPVTEGIFKKMDPWAKLGRLSFPIALFAFPFYLWKRSPGKEGSHYDPNCDLFTPAERNDILTSNAYLVGMLAILAAVGVTMGPVMLFKLYIVPYILNVVWLDVVTYLHHHGYEEKIPWYRGEEWNYMRGGLSTIDRDYGIFNNIHHDIGTHVVHHLFPQMPHYNLKDATEAVKPVLGEYYREPEKSKGPIPVHLIKPLVESFANDHVVPDEGDIVYYKKAF